eukprot:gene308-1990_t
MRLSEDDVSSYVNVEQAVLVEGAGHEQITGFVSQHLYHLLALLAPNKYKVNFAQLEDLRYILSS